MATGPANIRDLSLVQKPLLAAMQRGAGGEWVSGESVTLPHIPVPSLLSNGTTSLLQLQMSGVVTKTGASLTAVLNVSSSQASAGPRHLNNQCGKMDGVFCTASRVLRLSPFLPGSKSAL